MSTDPRTLVTDYIEAVGNKQFDRLLTLLQPDLDFNGPNVKHVQGGAEFVTGLRRLTLILDRNDIKKVLVQGNEACVIYDFVTNTPAGVVPSVEWLTLADGRIQSIYLIFDRARWPEVLEALQARIAQN